MKNQSYPGEREVTHPPSQVEKKSFGDRIVWANSWGDENVPVFKLFAHTIRSPDFFFRLGGAVQTLLYVILSKV